MLVFSIDPGVSGAICVFKNKDILDIYDVPTMVDGKKNKRQINSAQVTHIFKSFVKEGDKAKIRVIKTGIQDDTNIEAITGLKPGDVVIVGPYATVTKDLNSGDVVFVKNDEDKNQKPKK